MKRTRQPVKEMADSEPAKSNRPEKTAKSKTRQEIIGWLLFTLSAMVFMAAGLRNGDLLTLLASLIFLIACLVFLVSLIRLPAPWDR